MAESLLYRDDRVYGLAMRALYGRHYRARDRVVAELVPAGAKVLDVCCGPATIFRHELRFKDVRYHGLDANPGFVERLHVLGISGEVWDVSAPIALPDADVVMMQASLYHFLPDPLPVIDRMLSAARELVIISEPVRNLSASRLPPLAAIGRRATRVRAGSSERFDEQRLDALMEHYASAVRQSLLIPGGREKAYVLKAGAASRPSPAGP